ncbi:hypothetical protein AB0F81_41170 [Actinoplanes sp. NPDC024001]
MSDGRSPPSTTWPSTRWRALREAGLELDLPVRRTGPHEPTVAGRGQ